MAGKRSATTDLDHQNWDREEEPEGAGTYTKASEEVLQKRVIKSAKRRNPISNSDSTGKSAFGSFTGFNKPASTSFAFLNNIATTKEATSSMNGISNPSIFTQPSNVGNTIFKTSEHKTSNNAKDDEYYAKLKGLNESVSNWIKKHVDTNPFINLRPVFKDYEKYFDELELLKSKKQSEGNTAKKSKDDSASPASFNKELSSFVFKATNVSDDKEQSAAVATPQFSFGSSANAKESNTTSVTTPTFSFGSASTTTTSAPSFSFGSTTKVAASTGFSFGSPSGTPFSFTNVAQPAPSNKEEASEEQDDDEPPKVEFTPVVEQGHTYTVKCKVFVKNQDSFGDRGVGTLYLKPVPDNEKTQLIVRANTNLGNLLCNFILSKSIPTKRMGKKDVMLVCLPTPDSKPPPVPILLRVKSPEEADELLAELEKHKK
ncbi:ran binding protein [Holotrichia oblita]|uniref:Ran binding protein n=1 Tax=Holotrichia oblita TaxID=644536 RepID=A0ACB9T6W0_HOLOL|nr:ran binding protein [Holotrichia oblita]